MRHAIPEANPGLVELLSLSITFPLKITLGIPLYWAAIRWMLGRPDHLDRILRRNPFCAKKEA